tara:strand:- start:790 stop:1101 length:312 start_codon:yes stop_codon:yes gene_type:complete
MTVATAPRKRRTRKATVKKPVVQVSKVEVKEEVKKTVKKAVKSPIRTLKSVKRPSTSKLISPQRYLSDIKTRWAIHNYEITLLISDLTKGFNYVRDLSRQLAK